MHSKWLDLATEIAAFHYQSKRYDKYKPPSFGANPGVQSLYSHSSESLLDGSITSNFNIESRYGSAQSSSSRFGVNEMTPPPSPKKQTKHSPKNMTPNTRTRHAKQPTLTEIMKQMDHAEAEEEEMKRQSLVLEESKESKDGDDDDDDSNDRFVGSGNSLDQIDSEMGEEAGVGKTLTKKKQSWFHKMKERRSEAKSEHKTKRVENQRHLVDALPIYQDTVATITEESGNVLSSRIQLDRRRRKEKMKRRRSRHQPATARLFERKMIARGKESRIPHEEQLKFHDRFDLKTGKPYSVFTAFSRKHLREGNLDPDHIPPMLFLEECAHLLSLMSAVAFSTLRNDLPEAESPLSVFEPGLPWPLVDPDGYKSKVRKGWTQSKSRFYSVLQFALGRSRNDKARTLYNAARPFRVIGNVSDAEIEKLQEARGPLAKVSLISMWLLELISREYQAGSTGDVAAPIISRLYQFISEGLAGYNQARKIAYIPFPFPHAQITTLYLGVVDFFVTPLLMTTFVSNITLGCFLNLFSVLCFTGLHEVAREIENPFQNVPNDVPLNNYQAQFNEGLMVMFYGYHPDSYWNGKQKNNNDFNGTTTGNQKCRSGKTSASLKINIHDKTFKMPLNDNLNKNQSLAYDKPIDFSIGGNQQEGSGLDKTTNIRDINRTTAVNRSSSNQSTVDMPTDAFLRDLIGSRFDPSSTTDSFQKVPSENDSIQRFSDGSRGPSLSPVEFRIPKRTANNLSSGIQIPSNEYNSSPVSSEQAQEKKLANRMQSSKLS